MGTEDRQASWEAAGASGGGGRAAGGGSHGRLRDCRRAPLLVVPPLGGGDAIDDTSVRSLLEMALKTLEQVERLRRAERKEAKRKEEEEQQERKEKELEEHLARFGPGSPSFFGLFDDRLKKPAAERMANFRVRRSQWSVHRSATRQLRAERRGFE